MFSWLIILCMLFYENNIQRQKNIQTGARGCSHHLLHTDCNPIFIQLFLRTMLRIMHCSFMCFVENKILRHPVYSRRRVEIPAKWWYSVDWWYKRSYHDKDNIWRYHPALVIPCLAVSFSTIFNPSIQCHPEGRVPFPFWFLFLKFFFLTAVTLSGSVVFKSGIQIQLSWMEL